VTSFCCYSVLAFEAMVHSIRWKFICLMRLREEVVAARKDELTAYLAYHALPPGKREYAHMHLVAEMLYRDWMERKLVQAIEDSVAMVDANEARKAEAARL